MAEVASATMVKRNAWIAGVVLAVVNCRSAGRQAPADCPNPFSLSDSPAVMPASPRPVGRHLIVATVTDSVSGRGVTGAVVVLGAPGADRRDSTVASAYADGAGGVLLSDVPAGDLSMTVRAANYHPLRQVIHVEREIDTLRVTLIRAVALCSVRLTGESRGPAPEETPAVTAKRGNRLPAQTRVTLRTGSLRTR